MSRKDITMDKSWIRKMDHLSLAQKSSVSYKDRDNRFIYRPLTGVHPTETNCDISKTVFGKKVRAPIWISSITGGTEGAREINYNFARVASEYGLGMGLGSIRPLLHDLTRFNEFDVRAIIGDDLPLMANLGVCQAQELLEKRDLNRLLDILGKLRVDGLILHVNPLQEWLQSEGDIYKRPAIETISQMVQELGLKIVVKEVGQGMGPGSIRELMEAGVAGIELAGFGGTNFSKCELLRGDEATYNALLPLAHVGHTAVEMIHDANREFDNVGGIGCDFILSGGVKNFLDGHYLMELFKGQAVYGQAGALMNYSRSFEELSRYIDLQIQGLKFSKMFLEVTE